MEGSNDMPVGAYYEPRAPIVPVADHQAAQLVAQIGNAGLAAFINMHGAAQRARLEENQLQQQAVLQREGFEVARENNALDFQVQYKALQNQAVLNRAHANYYDQQTEMLKDGKLTAAQRTLEFNKQLYGLKKEAQDYATELNLTDPGFQTKNPVQFAANLQKFEEAYRTAPATSGIGEFIKAQRTIADQQKISIPLGGAKTTVPIWQVVRGLQDPNSHELYKEALADGGHMTEVPVPTEGRTKDWKRPIDTLWDSFVKGKAPTKTIEKPSDFIKPWLESGKTVDFGHVASRVPMSMQRSAATYVRPGAETPAAAPGDPNEDAPLPVPETTETDLLIAQARNAVRLKPEAAKQVRDYLTEKGIDPSLAGL